jgi:hypothetical protein
MPSSRKPLKPKPQQLLVEGKNDQHVIWALCEQHKLPETFSVEVPQEDDAPGIEALLISLPLKLKEENLRTLGIVVDADRDLFARWQAVRDRLNVSGYQHIPKYPPAGLRTFRSLFASRRSLADAGQSTTWHFRRFRCSSNSAR